MSNYEPIIEQNNTELQSNNTDLQGLLDTINALPVAENLDAVLAQQESLIDQIQAALEGKAGVSGPSVETCTVTIGCDSPESGVGYCDGSSNYQILSVGLFVGITETTIQVLKNSLIVPFESSFVIRSGNAEGLQFGNNHALFVSGDADIYIS